MKKKHSIEYTINRILLSDILPYETPVIFSNRYFYAFLNKKEKSDIDRMVKKYLLKKDKKNIINIPFKFKITHKAESFRELTIIHPENQVKVVEFYEENQNLILYYCSISPFSIRKPSKVARYTFYNDILHKKSLDKEFDYASIEQKDNEYENLKSYFSYYQYSNIHKFFESYQFHRVEKKYQKLIKIDIAKCFDSIYTHSISWAVLNKMIVKDNLSNSDNTFSGKFDKLMREANFNETNGIIIGPEFSRLFAEIILQQVDKEVYEELRKEDASNNSCRFKIDYEVFRYIDDYFIFFNDDIHGKKIVKTFEKHLKTYQMHLNESKLKTYDKPIITEISIAKQKISDLFNNYLDIKVRTELDEENNEELIKSIYYSSNNVITRFKTIIKETKIEYRDILNYSLAILDRKIKGLIKKYSNFADDEKNLMEKALIKGILEILDIAFFIYSVSPRVNFTIKICLILEKIIKFLTKNKSNKYIEPLSKNNKHRIFKKIADDISLILQKNKSSSEASVETLYLLIALSQLGREYRLSLDILASYFNIKVKKDNRGIPIVNIRESLNYFSITTLLFYIRDIKIYEPLKEELKKHILSKYDETVPLEWQNNTELVLLLFDILTCPYLNNKTKKVKQLKDKYKDALKRNSKNKRKYQRDYENLKYDFKKELLNKLNINDNQIPLIKYQKYWFIKWTEFDFSMELMAKRSQEVY